MKRSQKHKAVRSYGRAQKHPPLSEVVRKQQELSPKQDLLRRILAIRDSIEAQRGILPESYPLIRKDRDR
ncbi:MAG: hypothetical protein C5B51_20090 [Terriglobia bacterium]|nr:MAG: hypothetical protein C5B51_20090 [Terriglobia bacterium]